jgi:DNA-binding NarL/FixJ family response regulator
MVTPDDLTARQLAVAALVARGQSDKAIASALGMGTRRVQVHIAAIAYLCHFDPTCNTRVQLALWYREHVPITVESFA